MPLLDRSDQVITRGLLTVVAIAAPVVLLALPVIDRLRGAPLGWSGALADPTRVEALGADADPLRPAAGARLSWDGAASVTLADASLGLWLATLVPLALVATVIAVVAWSLRGLVADIGAGRPFAPANAVRLRVVALTILAGVVAVPLSEGLVGRAVARAALVDDPAIGWRFDLPLTWLLVGVVVLFVAEAFRVGTALSADVEGLV